MEVVLRMGVEPLVDHPREVRLVNGVPCMRSAKSSGTDGLADVIDSQTNSDAVTSDDRCSDPDSEVSPDHRDSSGLGAGHGPVVGEEINVREVPYWQAGQVASVVYPLGPPSRTHSPTR